MHVVQPEIAALDAPRQQDVHAEVVGLLVHVLQGDVEHLVFGCLSRFGGFRRCLFRQCLFGLRVFLDVARGGDHDGCVVDIVLKRDEIVRFHGSRGRHLHSLPQHRGGLHLSGRHQRDGRFGVLASQDRGEAVGLGGQVLAVRGRDHGEAQVQFRNTGSTQLVNIKL